MRLREIVQNNPCRKVFIEEYPIEERGRMDWMLLLWKEIDYLLDMKQDFKNNNEEEPHLFGEFNSLISLSTLSLEIYESYFKENKYELREPKVISLFKSQVEKIKQEGQKTRFWKSYSSLMQMNQVFAQFFKKIQQTIESELKLKINSIWMCYLQEYDKKYEIEEAKLPRELSGIYFNEKIEGETSTVSLRAGTIERITEWLVWKGNKSDFVCFVCLHQLFVTSEKLFRHLMNIYKNPSLIQFSNDSSPILIRQNIIQFSKIWIEIFQNEIEDSPKLLNKMINFGDEIEDPSFKIILSKLVKNFHF